MEHQFRKQTLEPGCKFQLCHLLAWQGTLVPQFPYLQSENKNRIYPPPPPQNRIYPIGLSEGLNKLIFVPGKYLACSVCYTTVACFVR